MASVVIVSMEAKESFAARACAVIQEIAALIDNHTRRRSPGGATR
jgi:hypothetical protein